MMKRSRGEGEEGDVELANCLMLLSARDGSYHHHETSSQSFSGGRVFECKTCNRQFPSFQALGGHRASHKRARASDEHHDRASNSPAQPKTHGCAICGTEFAMGQALGGHMRRHRAELESSGSIVPVVKKPNGTKRLYLDLNMPPLEIDGDFLGIGFVGKVPMVH